MPFTSPSYLLTSCRQFWRCKLHFPSVMSFYKCAEELSLCYALRCVCNEIRIPFVQHLPAVFYSWPNVATYWPSMLAGCTLLVCEFSIGINSICRFSMCIDGYGHAWHTFANAFNAFSAGMGIFWALSMGRLHSLSLWLMLFPVQVTETVIHVPVCPAHPSPSRSLSRSSVQIRFCQMSTTSQAHINRCKGWQDGCPVQRRTTQWLVACEGMC